MSEEKICKNAIITVNNLSFRYKEAQQQALKDVSLCFEEAKFHLIVGSSGSGKSTLLRSIIGLVPHVYEGDYSGEVTVLGKRVDKTPISELALTVGYVFQNPENQIFMFNVERDIAFSLENLGFPPEVIRERLDWVLEMLGIKSIRNKMPHELSDGQKQKVAIAGVLALEPRVLILDEPTSLLDPATATEIIQILNYLKEKLGLTILLVEHRLELVLPIADMIIALKDGKVILQGNPRELLRDISSIIALRSSRVSLPPVIEVYWELIRRGYQLRNPPLTVDELLEQIPTGRKQ